MRAAIVLCALVVLGADYPRHRRFRQPNLPSGGGAFTLAATFEYGQYNQVPACTGDSTCVAVCKVSSTPNWQCYDNTGAALTGMTQGTGAVYADSFAMSASGTWVRAYLGMNDSASADAIPRIDNSVFRSLVAGDHTVVYAGYPTTTVNVNGGWYGMITDATDIVQHRRDGSNLECLYAPTGLVAEATLALNGQQVWSCRRSGNTITARAKGVEGSSITATTAAVAAGNSWYFGGTGGCCTPGGSMHGQLFWVAFFNVAKTVGELQEIERQWWGVPQVAGATGSIGNVSGIIGEDDVPDSGRVNVFEVGAYVADPTTGILTRTAMQNFMHATDPLAVGGWVDVGTPTIANNVHAGPFYQWKVTNECDRITDNDGAAFEGKRSATAGSTDSWYNGSFYLLAGDAGATNTKARVSFTTNGTLDAGSLTCDISGLDWIPRRYPADTGCPIYASGDTGGVKVDILVGNAAADQGDIVVCQGQLTKSLYMLPPTVDGTSKGAAYVESDGGAVPYGAASKGKVEAVFQVPYSTTQMAPNYDTSKSVGSYVYDGLNEAATTHSVLTWFANQAGVSSAQSLMYGPSGDPGDGDNRFGLSPTLPYTLSRDTFYVVSYEWRPVSGGCRGKYRLDSCADPATCQATTIVAENVSGAVGECASQTNLLQWGTRINGSNPSDIKVRRASVYR